jgi:hypothetical protein
MGIDAEMFVRNSGPSLDETEVRRLARDLCARFGHDKFMIQREDKPWSKAHHALEILEPAVWEQDGPDIIAEPGEQFIRVHLYTRYYGEGYERGDWPLIKGTAEFLEGHISNARIWYGGDSSGLLAEPLDYEARLRLDAHWISTGHEPYNSRFGGYGPPCEFCGGSPFHRRGGGPDRQFFSCDGCGVQIVRINGHSYYLGPDESVLGWQPPSGERPQSPEIPPEAGSPNKKSGRIAMEVLYITRDVFGTQHIFIVGWIVIVWCACVAIGAVLGIISALVGK